MFVSLNSELISFGCANVCFSGKTNDESGGSADSFAGPSSKILKQIEAPKATGPTAQTTSQTAVFKNPDVQESKTSAPRSEYVTISTPGEPTPQDSTQSLTPVVWTPKTHSTPALGESVRTKNTTGKSSRRIQLDSPASSQLCGSALTTVNSPSTFFALSFSSFFFAVRSFILKVSTQ